MSTEVLTINFYPSPLGVLTILTGPAGLRHLAFPGEGSDMIRDNSLAKEYPDAAFVAAADDGGSYLEVRRQLDAYFAGRLLAFDLPLDLRGTPFQLSVWKALQKIPYGITYSYSDIADVIGKPHAARAVGQATGRNPVGIIIPCHRVIGKDGRLVGFGGGLAAKEWLLGFEKSHSMPPDAITVSTLRLQNCNKKQVV